MKRLIPIGHSCRHNAALGGWTLDPTPPPRVNGGVGEGGISQSTALRRRSGPAMESPPRNRRPLGTDRRHCREFIKKRISHSILGAMFFMSAAALADRGATVELETWPSATHCPACISLQVDEMLFRLPVSDIDKVITFGSMPGMEIMLPGDTRNNPTSFTIIAFKNNTLLDLSSRPEKSPGEKVQDHQQLFDLIGQWPPASQEIEQLRKIHGFGFAKRITKASSEGIQAYTLWPAEGYKQTTIIFAFDGCTATGCNDVYKMTGNIPESLRVRILSHMRRTPLP